MTGEPENDTSTDSEQPAETQTEIDDLPSETQTEAEEQPSETQEETEETASETEEVKTEPAKPEANADDENVRYINLTMLTPRDGLPTSAGRITGMGDPNNITYIERTQRSDRVNKFQASVFSGKTGIALIAGGAVIIAAAAFVIFKKRSGKKAPAAPQKSKKR